MFYEKITPIILNFMDLTVEMNCLKHKSFFDSD